MQTCVNFLENPKSDLRVKYEADLYQEELIDSFQNYISDDLVPQNAVDEEALLHLLRLYNMFPSYARYEQQVKYSALILVNSLAFSPVFFRACSSMIPQHIRKAEQVQTVLTAASLLFACNFEDFWSNAAELIKATPELERCIQEYIALVFNVSHQSVQVDILKKSLNVDDKQLQAFAEEKHWKVGKDSVTMSSNEENQLRAKKFKENIDFAQMIDLIKVISK